MNISILVPNHSDLRMINMVESIDCCNSEDLKIELLIILNRPTKEVLKQSQYILDNYSEKFSVKIINEKICNLGYLYNRGVKEATYDNLLFIDSDVICEKGSIKRMIESMIENNADLVKARLVYKAKSSFVVQARRINTSYTKEPYIPVVLFSKKLFKKISGDYVFAVDTVWCSDAEFAYRVLNSDAQIVYEDAFFYHDNIGVMKDLKDAVLYGCGKGIRIKRTQEEWRPCREILQNHNRAKREKIKLVWRLYSDIWIVLQQIACGIQVHLPILFKETLPFEKSMKIEEIKYEDSEI